MKVENSLFVEWVRLPQDLQDSFRDYNNWRFSNDVDYVLDVSNEELVEGFVEQQIEKYNDNCSVEEWLEDNWCLDFALKLKKHNPEIANMSFTKIVVEVCW